MPRRPASRKRSSRRRSSRKVTFSKSRVPKYSGSGKYEKKPVHHKGYFEKAGGLIGGGLGQMLGGITGTGDYTLPDGTSVLAPEPPRIQSTADGCVITHREYLGDILSSTTPNTFKIESYGLNPADTNTFPWLSNVAQPNFQQYKFDSLLFEFRTFSADSLNSVNTALGSVFSCINYDYNDPAVQSRYEVENTDWSRACKPSQSMIVPVECDPKQTGLNQGLLYVVNGNNVPANTDAKTYYMGKLYIGTTGLQGSNVNIGSLYVTYSVRLYKPVMTLPLSNALIMTQVRDNCTNSQLFGSNERVRTKNCDSIGVTFTNNGNTMVLSHKRLIIGARFQFIWQCVGASTSNVSHPNLAISSNAQGLSLYNDYSSTSIVLPSGSAGQTQQTALIVYWVVNDNTSDIEFTLSGGNVPSSAHVSIIMQQVCGIPLEQIGKYVL